MTCFRLIATLTLTALALSGPALAGDSDTTEFRVDSYIPDRFTDFEWRLDGGMGLDRTASDYPFKDFGNADRYDTRDNTSETGAGILLLDNFLRYQYQTRQGFFDLSTGIESLYDYKRVESRDSTLDTLGNLWIREGGISKQRNNVSTTLSGDARRHLVADLFVRAHGKIRHYYLESRGYEVDESWSSTWNDSARFTEDMYSKGWKRERYYTRRFDLTGELHVGWGRIYEGRFAATALLIIDELARRRLLVREPDHSEMMGLTRLIHSLRLGHGPDDREYRIDALSGIIEFLAEAGVVQAAADVTFVIEDVWDYFPDQARRFGFTAAVGFGGVDDYYNRLSDESASTEVFWTRSYADSAGFLDTVEIRYSNSSTSAREKIFKKDDYLTIVLEYNNPLSARWQLDASTWVRFHFDSDRPPFDVSEYPTRSYHGYVGKRSADAQVSLSYYHDGRTEVVMGLGGSFFRRVDRDHYFHLVAPGQVEEFVTEYHHRRWAYELSAAVSYRVAVSTSIGFDWTFSRQVLIYKRPEYESRSIQQGFTLSAGITHWLF